MKLQSSTVMGTRAPPGSGQSTPPQGGGEPKEGPKKLTREPETGSQERLQEREKGRGKGRPVALTRGFMPQGALRGG
jgi:hypothetical protein